MAVRFTTTLATAESAEWSPSGVTFLQFHSDDREAQVEVLAKVTNDPGCPWDRIEVLKNANGVIRVPEVPSLKLAIIRNSPGSTLTVWGND
jgi:hypothetical protein